MGRAEELDAARVLGRRGLEAGDVDDVHGVVDGRVAGAPVERLADGARGLDGEEPGLGRHDDEGVGDAFGDERHAAAADTAAFAVGLDLDLAVEHIGHLVGFGVEVQGRCLVLDHRVLEQEEGAVGLVGEQLPEVEPAAGERLLVAFAGVAARSGSMKSLAPPQASWDTCPITKLRYHLDRVNCV